MIRLRDIPSINVILESPSFVSLLREYPRHIVREVVRDIVSGIRVEPNRFSTKDIRHETLARETRRRLEHRLRFSLIKVINATGTVLHTNLGRAPLAPEISERIAAISEGYCNLELSLETGKRGLRTDHICGILKEITGAEAGIAVNNNAGAVLLALTVLAKDREVIISRGELIEIGGGFRIPEVMAASGAILREVGTTNRTHLRDYEQAINENTALILKAHRSNYDISGFTCEVSVSELAALSREHHIHFMYDSGSGCLADLSRIGLSALRVGECIDAGVDVITFSGDKLLGGPQAGIIAGRKDLIRSIERHPLARALRLDKVTLTSLESTLAMYRDPDNIFKKIPVLQLLSREKTMLKRLAERLRKGLARLNKNGFHFKTRPDISAVGGGALPSVSLPTWVVEVHSDHHSAETLLMMFRKFNPPVVGRIRKDQFILDMRTVFQAETALIVKGFDDFFNDSRP